MAVDWTFTIEVSGDDLPVFSARVVQTSPRRWTAEYFQDGELISNGFIGAGHDDLPFTIVQGSLETHRKVARYWRDHPSGAPDRQ